MSKTVNPVVWVEIPVANMERARLFYEAVFGWKLTVIDMGVRQMAMLSSEMDSHGSGGALVKERHFVPSYAGSLVYFSVNDIPRTLAGVVLHGGKELIPKTSIGEYGFCAYFEDSEGNRIGLHTPQFAP